jgi:hypothetical protein
MIIVARPSPSKTFNKTKFNNEKQYFIFTCNRL